MKSIIHAVITLVALVVSCMSIARGESGDCQVPLPQAEKQNLLEYVRKKYSIPSSMVLNLARAELIGGTCYRRLTFQVKNAFSTRELVLFLSPDKRFLIGELLDTQLDPGEEERRRNDALMAGLDKGSIPSIGPSNASVTIVEFSDFECPFCRKFTNILNEALASEGYDVRVVFHHFPLPSHAWARVAAEGAACAQLQDGDAFWRLQEKLFENQTLISSDNINKKLLEFAQTDRRLDLKRYQSCLQNELSLGLVLQDINLGSAHEVTGTPTIFINGRRAAPIKNSSQLLELIRNAKEEIRSDLARGKADNAADVN